MKCLLLATAITAATTAAIVGCTQSNAPTYRADATRGVVVIETNVDAVARFSEGAPNAIPAGVPTPIPMPPGTYALAIEADGFLTRRYDLLVNPHEEVRISLEMWPEVEEIDQ